MHRRPQLHLVVLRAIACVGLLLGASLACAINWNYLDGPFGGQPLALFNDSGGNTWAGLNGGGVYIRPAGTSTWIVRPGLPNQNNAHFTADSAGTVFVSGSSGLFAWPANGTSWIAITGTNGLPDQAADGLTTDAAGNVYVAINRMEVFKRAAGQSAWASAGTGLPLNSLPNDLVADSAGNLWASVLGGGVYKLPAGSTTWINASTGLPQLNVTALAIAGNDLFAAMQSGGVALLANPASGNTTFVPWTGGAMGVAEPITALAAGPNNSLYAAGNGFVFRVQTGANEWTVVGTGIESHGPGYALVYSNATGQLTLGNGSGVLTLASANAVWQLAVDGMTASTIHGIAVAANGDLYAATFGQGLQLFASATGTWSAVDPANSHPVVGTVVIDSHGTVFATPGGAVKKLVGGAWQTAGASQNSFAYALAVDASDAVWAGVNGGVRRLPAGASAWVATGGGLANRTVTSLAIGAGGAAYAGVYGGGVYTLAPGATTWAALNSGLDLNVLVLQRDASGAIYAGTDSGVFKLVGSAWQKVGAGLLQFVGALVFDANGDLYAGTDTDYVWRLPAGGIEWTQVKLGLASRSVPALAAGGGRIYAGTDGARGAPSGVHSLYFSDTVVEFYNSILDHFFITSSAIEQTAILNGSAGPGWSMTGNVFSAGGLTFVCRFYGSVSPGPNSHFYTIDPDECQQLKNLQAQIPASQKRWNFESNDFAGVRPENGRCPVNWTPIYRAYNGGFTKGIDSNHRITPNQTEYFLQVGKGWVGEGVVMCAPR